ncbi:hypothetical protein EMM73_04340 [Rheinheimera sediminis]|uniref:hypothetical protein n=1 Tax=Rheinheimera sp. YQF-1 TaxID=2499626 RepID=UPI000FD83911|nr:hypothetical protein [Rheinheimera sp. YQF-1]RVT47511.1 hypothetical protein EMM73_04340 [Rheinheimera sp. YQF-1]
MEHWQYIIAQGNQAFTQRHFAAAVTFYRQAISDVWPVWYHCGFVFCPPELSREEASLPTFCLSISIQNLAETYAQQQRWRRCQATLKQGVSWFEQMLQRLDGAHPASIAVLQESAKLRAEYKAVCQRYKEWQLSSLPVDRPYLH